MAKRLKPEWEHAHELWESHNREYGCRCWLVQAPCDTCLHEGNPMNLAETPEAWEDDFDMEELVQQAKNRLAAQLSIEVTTHQHEVQKGFQEARQRMEEFYVRLDQEAVRS